MKRHFFGSILLLFPLFSAGCSSDNFVMIFSGAEDERNAYLYQRLYERFPNYEIIIQSVGSGTVFTKLANEGVRSDCDIFYDLDITNAAQLNSMEDDGHKVLANLSSLEFTPPSYDSSVTSLTGIEDNFLVNCKTDLVFIVNHEVLEENNLPVPSSFADLTNPVYRGYIQMPNPQSSGTGYGFYNGMASLYGKEAALSYFREFGPNVTEFTSSGSVPLKSLDRGEIGIAIGMLWQGYQYELKNPDLEVIIPEEGCPYNLFTMGMVDTHELRPAAFDVFRFLVEELNYDQTLRFTSDVIYENQGASLTEGYPTDVKEIPMKGLKDPAYKKDLLDSWEF